MRSLSLLPLVIVCLGMRPADAAIYSYRFQASDFTLTDCGAAPYCHTFTPGPIGGRFTVSDDGGYPVLTSFTADPGQYYVPDYSDLYYDGTRLSLFLTDSTPTAWYLSFADPFGAITAAQFSYTALYSTEVFASYDAGVATVSAAVVPLPAALPLLASGLGALAFLRRRRSVPAG